MSAFSSSPPPGPTATDVEEAKLRQMLITPMVANTSKPVEIRRRSSWEVKGILIRCEKGVRSVQIGTTELSLEELNALRAALTEVEAVFRCL